MDLMLSLATITGPGGWSDGNPEWWWLVVRGLMTVVWIVLVVLIVRWIFRPRWRGPSGMERARDILAERYARGEITADEYQQRLDRLK